MKNNSIKKEIWVTVNGFTNYKVSTEGRVYNTKTKKYIANKGDGGYWRVNLSQDGKSRSVLLHRLVAETFLDNPNDLPEVNHIDENKDNNALVNLEYCDRDYNSSYGDISKKISEAKKGQTYDRAGKILCQFDSNFNLVATYNSALEAERKTNGELKSRGISRCALGERKTYKGFIFSYEPAITIPLCVITKGVITQCEKQSTM